MLQPWHDFYAILGTASATLVGLMFVAASIGGSVFTSERQVGLRVFLSPTVVAFSVVLAISLIAALPVDGPRVPAGLLACLGGLGAVYSWRVWRRMIQSGIAGAIDHEDRAWYFAAPAVAYLLLATAGAAFLLAPNAANLLLVIAACLLLLAGIRNAWDMTTWVVLRSRE